MVRCSDAQLEPDGEHGHCISQMLLTMLLEGDRPFDRAWLLLAWVRSCFGPDEWREVFLRSQALDDTRHSTAIRRLGEAIAGHPQSRALHALNNASRDAALDIATRSPTPARGLAFPASPIAARVRRLPRVTREARDRMGRALAHAVMAVAVAPRLEPLDVALLASPVLEPLRALRAGTESLRLLP